MMSNRPAASFASAVLVFSLVFGSAHAETWTRITDASVVKTLISGKAIFVKSEYYRYHDTKGNSVEFNPVYNWTNFRKWKVRKDGTVCQYIYTMPDRQIDCFTFSRSSVSKNRFLMRWPEGSGYPFTVLKVAPKKLVDALRAKTEKR